MSMLAALFLSFLQPAAQPATGSAASVQVDVGRFDPAEFPELIRLERRMPENEMHRRVEAMIADGRCRLEGATERRFNIVVPFAISMQADGTPVEVVIHEAGCEALETLVGQIVLAQLRRGDFRPQHRDGERWYVSEVGFAMGVQADAVTMAQDNPDRTICREVQMELGSRLRPVRRCLTAAQWVQFEADREQLRRDIQNAARCGAKSCGFEGTSNGRN
ncbi:MAG TPA: hypothetical protein VGB79_15340 [Allosphingosinicella sp.]|jgi:hypothetical protein